MSSKAKPVETVPISVLLVEDSSGDVRLMREALKEANAQIVLSVVSDGVEAMEFLRLEGQHASAPRPDLILLDLNLPKIDGRRVLALIKGDEQLKTIPTLVLTTSQSDADIAMCYQLQANCFLNKPVQLEEFYNMVDSISDFWLSRVSLPNRRRVG
jgi:chemotaxis family two-component system response regulator Rcp1